MSSDLLIGWVLGIASSLITGLFLFWLEGQREARREKLKQRRDDYRTALNWNEHGRKISLRGFHLEGANLSGKDFSGADLEGAHLQGAILWKTNLEGANLRGTNFQKANVKGASFRRAMLYRADFTDAIVVRADFTEAILLRTKLRDAELFEDCIWQHVVFDRTTEMTHEQAIVIQTPSGPAPEHAPADDKVGANDTA